MNRTKISGALILGAALALPGIGHAQATDDKTPAVAEIEPLETTQIVVKNVASNLMVYWFDPQHQPTPVPLQTSQRNAGMLFNRGIGMKPQPGNGNGPGNLRLPAGIQNFASIDPQNVLWARGTKAAIEALQAQIKEIDVPLNQIEFEVQIWEMSPNTLESLPLIFRDTAAPADSNRQSAGGKRADNFAFNADFLSRVALAAPTSDIAPTTQILTASAKTELASLITAPRLTVIDGLVSALQTNESRALLLNEPQAAPKNPGQTPPVPVADSKALPEGFALVNGQTGVTIAPTLRGDAMTLTFSILLDGNMTQAATTLRDGQTLAVRLPRGNTTTGWPRVTLITPHIIRRDSEKSEK